MRKVSRFLPFVAALVAAAPLHNISFEPKPRALTTGRDPVLAVRASGAVSLLKVDNKDLWLQTSFDGGDSFETKVRVNDVPGEVSSHSESSPQMQVRTRSEFYVVWQKRRPGGDGSSLRFARSMNWGETFTKATNVDASHPVASQSFYAMNVSPKGVIYVAWLDGRDRGQGKAGSSAVYIARSTNRGVSFEPAVRVSLDSCPCCRPSISFTGERNVHVTWRRVIGDNIRDIFVSTSKDGGVTWKDVRVAEDNWKINGCPHSGAATTTLGNTLFVTWSTVREGKMQLYTAFSADAGETFSPRLPVAGDVVDPNHPHMIPAGDRIAVVFQGRDAGQANGWGLINAYYREIRPGGGLSDLTRIGNAGNSVSYPVIAYEEPGRIFTAWTENAGEERRVVLARARRSVQEVTRVR
jgi:hypothetical protein